MREFTFGSASSGTGGLTILGANTLNFINPPGAPSINIEFHRHWVGFSNTATSAQQRIQLVTQVTAFPSLVSATPSKLKRQDPAASTITGGTAGAAGTAGINATGENGGAKTLWWEDDFNVLNGYLRIPTPAETEIVPAGYSSGVGLWFPVAPTVLSAWSWGQNYREV
jgi:hypothetical protein